VFARRICLYCLNALAVWLLGYNMADAELIAYWNFDTDYNASVGSPTYDAIPANGASISSVQSKWGGAAAHFDKALSQYATTTASPVPNGTYSFSHWYYLDVEATGSTPNRQFATINTGNAASEPSLFYNIDGDEGAPTGNDDDIGVSRVLTNGPGGGQSFLIFPLPRPTNHQQWVNYIGTVAYNAGTNTTRLEGFYNGVSLGSHTTVGRPEGSTHLVFGADRDLGGRFWEGYIDDVAIYDHVLTAEEITSLQTGPAAMGEPPDPPDPPNGRATLWQLPNVLHGMSYVIRSPTGRIAVFDGGSDGGGTGINGGGGPPVDKTYLRSFLQSLGGHVDDWFISHPHSDHVSVLTSILESPTLEGLTIDNIYAQLPSESWLEQYEPVNMLPSMQAFKAALAARGKSVIEPALGQEIILDGMKFQVLSEIDETNHINDPNDYSMVVKLTTPNTSVLFLGDLGVEGGRLLLDGEFGDDLESEYVQMAHHGSHGVERDVYEAVAADYALWPAQDWLYDAPPDSPHYTSWQVRQWMEELGVMENYVMKDGLHEIDLGPVPDASTMAGDYNGDGTVDAADYVLWRSTLDTSVVPGRGADGNANGTIDEGDYALWQARFGNTVPALGTSTAVPEPAALPLALLAISLGLVRWRRNARD
jgi:beta-lactamase superfamily II metal-dependent hydrolase